MGLNVAELSQDWTAAKLGNIAHKLKCLGVEPAKVEIVYNGLWVHLEGLTYNGATAHITITPGPGEKVMDWSYFHLTVVKYGATHAYYVTEDDGVTIERTDKVVDKDARKTLKNAGEHNNNALLPTTVDADVETIVEMLCVHKWSKAP